MDPSTNKTLDWPEELLWNFSVTYYARHGVSRSLLDLQDQYDLDVNLILLAIWAGTEPALHLKKENFAALDTVASNWRDSIIKPLRAVRRALKTPTIARNLGESELRAAVAAAELDAEHLAQIALAKKMSELDPLVTTNEPAAIVTANLDAYFEYAGVQITQKIKDTKIFLVSQADT